MSLEGVPLPTPSTTHVSISLLQKLGFSPSDIISFLRKLHQFSRPVPVTSLAETSSMCLTIQANKTGPTGAPLRRPQLRHRGAPAPVLHRPLHRPTRRQPQLPVQVKPLSLLTLVLHRGTLNPERAQPSLQYSQRGRDISLVSYETTESGDVLTSSVTKTPAILNTVLTTQGMPLDTLEVPYNTSDSVSDSVSDPNNFPLVLLTALTDYLPS